MGARPACVPPPALLYPPPTFLKSKPLTTVYSEKFGAVPVLGGLFRRELFEPFLMGRTTVYFAREGMLVPVEKSVSRELADSPREQLAALIEGPGAREKSEGMEATLPDLVGEEDILGIALEKKPRKIYI